jgi:hypothetical protein
MERYATPRAFREALEQRLRTASEEAGVHIDRLRRRVVFERLLARLEHAEPGLWIVKGAMALEVRDPDRSRRTKDLDLAVRQRAEDVQALLSAALTIDSFGDYFAFDVPAPTPLATDEAGDPAWRFRVQAALDERLFETVGLDVVERPQEISRTVRMTFPSLVAFADLPPVEVEVVEPQQHFAEKLHAYTRSYEDRPNTRVKDLPDMVLLIEGGLTPDDELYSAVVHVFETRGLQSVPEAFPDPPSGWEERYASIAGGMDIRARDLNSAVEFVRGFWAETVEAGKG